MLNYANNEDDKMAIHYTYKSQAGERALKKQSKQFKRQHRSHNRKLLKQQQKNKINFTVPVNTCITMDMLTDPKRNDKV